MSLTWKSQDPADGGGGGCSFAKDGEGGCFGRADDGAEAAAAAKALATTSGSFTLSGCSEPAAATKASAASARCFTLIGFFWGGGEHDGVLGSGCGGLTLTHTGAGLPLIHTGGGGGEHDGVLGSAYGGLTLPSQAEAEATDANGLLPPNQAEAEATDADGAETEAAAAVAAAASPEAAAAAAASADGAEAKTSSRGGGTRCGCGCGFGRGCTMSPSPGDTLNGGCGGGVPKVCIAGQGLGQEAAMTV